MISFFLATISSAYAFEQQTLLDVLPATWNNNQELVEYIGNPSYWEQVEPEGDDIASIGKNGDLDLELNTVEYSLSDNTLFKFDDVTEDVNIVYNFSTKDNKDKKNKKMGTKYIGSEINNTDKIIITYDEIPEHLYMIEIPNGQIIDDTNHTVKYLFYDGSVYRKMTERHIDILSK